MGSGKDENSELMGQGGCGNVFWVLKDEGNALRVREWGVYVMLFPCISVLWN